MSWGGDFFSIGGEVPVLGSSLQKRWLFVEIHQIYLKFSSLAPAVLAILYMYNLAGNAPKNSIREPVRLAQYQNFCLNLAILTEFT